MDTLLMNSQDLLERMLDPAAAMPWVDDVPATLALRVSEIADRLTPEEIQGFIDLGVFIKRRMGRMVPLLGTVGD